MISIQTKQYLPPEVGRMRGEGRDNAYTCWPITKFTQLEDAN